MARNSRQSWNDLADLLGDEVVQRLASRLGGCDIVVPSRYPGTRNSLRDALGNERLYRRMVAEWGGCKIYVPDLSVMSRRERDRRIRARRAAGEAVREISLAEGLSVRQVRNIVSRLVPADPRLR